MTEEAMAEEATMDETPVQEVETETQELEQVDSEEATTSDGDDSAAKPKPKGVQKRIDELTALRYDAERDRDYWRELAISNQTQKPQQPEIQAQPQGKPNADSYDDYDQYISDLAKYEAQQIVEAQRKETEALQARTQQEQLTHSFTKKAETFSAEHPDFNSVISNPYLQATETMREAILVSDKGPDVAYYLGKNPDESARIAGLSSVQQIRELTLIEARLTAKPKPKPSSAPDPISPVGGNQPPVADPSKMSTDEWMKWRNSQLNN